MAEHWVAHTRDGDRGLVEPERAAWLWARLTEALPRSLSCLLMPEHLHLVARPAHGGRLRRALTGYTRRFGVRFDLAPPQPAASPAIALRQMRYGFFNPVRAALVCDPWAWRWSTLRDLGGACDPVWTSLDEIAATLRLPEERALRQLTTLADHHPSALASSPPLVAALPALVAAVASALRCPEAEVLRTTRPRRLLIQACTTIGAPRAASLAAELGCSRRTVERATAQRDPALSAVLRCLADPRLRHA